MNYNGKLKYTRLQTMSFQQNANYIIIDWRKEEFDLLKSLIVFRMSQWKL